MRIRTRDLDAETLVEFTSQLTKMGYWEHVPSREYGMRAIYGIVRTFLNEHEDRDWSIPTELDYWQTIDNECRKIVNSLEPMDKIVVIIEGGNLRSVFCSRDSIVTLIDRDNEKVSDDFVSGAVAGLVEVM